MRLASLAWRGVVARPLRSALTVAGIAVGVAVVTATLIANQAATDAVRRASQELLGNASLRVRAFDPAGFTPRGVTTLRRIPGVTAAAPVGERRLTITTPPGPDEQVFSLLALGVDPELEPAVRDPRLVAGSPLSAEDPTGVLLNARWAAEHGQDVGDELRIVGRLPDAPVLRVIGLVDDLGFGALEQGEVMLVSRSLLDASLANPTPVLAVDVVIGPGREAEVQAALDAQLREPFVVETAADAQARFAAAQTAFAPIAFLFGLVALVVGAFLVANTLAMTLAERTREIGLLRAAGTTGRQVLGLFARQGLLFGLAGAALGILLGIGLAAAMIGFLRSTRAVLVDGLPVSLPVVLVAAGLGIGVTVVASAVPALAAARTGPLDALRPSRRPGATLSAPLRWLVLLELGVVLLGIVVYPFDRGSSALPAIVLALALLVGGALAAAWLLLPLGRIVGRPFEWAFGAEGMLGRANLGRDRVRTGLTVGALMIALAAVVALGSVADSARQTAARWVGSVLPGGTAIRMALPEDIELFRPTFTQTPGVAQVSPIAEFPGVVSTPQGGREVSLAGIDPTVFQDAGSLIFVAGDRAVAFNALRAGGAVLVPEPIARRDGVAVGDLLEIGEPGAAPATFSVAGVIAYTLPARSPDGALVISLADAATHFGATTAGLWAMVPEPGVAPAAFRSAVADTARSLAAEPIDATQLAGELARSLDRLIGLFDVLALVAVAVAAAGIVNALSVGVVERAREIAILRSHGMTASQVQAMVVSEASILGAVGGVLAAAVGLGVAWVMTEAGAPRDFAAGLSVPWALLVVVILLGTGVAAIAGIYPARLAARQPIVGSLKHFE
ncbi:MAG TPA: FtsX-like permease family protein [Candidatus Limnocylindria bacterium]|nr:FtsX-like permease family protein [Candidatus Limnocylindria bacterium]